MGFDFDDSAFTCEPVAVAAPWPVFGFIDEAALDGIAVDVAKFLGELPLREDVEIVVALFPEMLAVASESFGGLCFQCAEDALQFRPFRLVYKEMDVLGHKHVAEYVEAVTGARAFEKFKEDCLGVVVVEEGKTLKATEGDEVVVSEGVEALQSARHCSEDTESFPT